MKKVLRGMIYLILFAILIWGFIYLGKKDFSTNISDAELFSKEYKAVSSDNPFVYVTSSDVLDILKNKTGIILVGFQSNAWMQEYVKQLYPILRDNNIKKVYYYDVLEDRTKKTKNFREIEDLLSNYLKITDMGVEYLFTPALIFVKNGEVVNYDDETSLVSINMQPNTYWDNDTISAFRDKINIYLSEVDYNE
ncbi:MAG: hypothetical protein PUD34_04215 [bacterium]|nr:hypothetical protein [bacterium]